MKHFRISTSHWFITCTAAFLMVFTSCQPSLKLAGNKYAPSHHPKDKIATYTPTPPLSVAPVLIELEEGTPQSKALTLHEEETPIIVVESHEVTSHITSIPVRAKPSFRSHIKPIISRKKSNDHDGKRLEGFSIAGFIFVVLGSLFVLATLIFTLTEGIAFQYAVIGISLLVIGGISGIVGFFRIQANEGELRGVGYAITAIAPLAITMLILTVLSLF